MGSFAYTKKVLEDLDQNIRNEIQGYGGNEPLIKLLDELKNWSTIWANFCELKSLLITEWFKFYFNIFHHMTYFRVILVDLCVKAPEVMVNLQHALIFFAFLSRLWLVLLTIFIMFKSIIFSW